MDFSSSYIAHLVCSCLQLEMKVLSVLSAFLALALVSAYVSASVLSENPSISSEIALDKSENAALGELTNTNGASLNYHLEQEPEQPLSRVRRACDCRRKSGECVAYGTYQCSSRRDAVIVQCVGYKWVRIGDCPKSCKVLSNNQPYCF